MKDVALWNLVLKGDMKAMSLLYKKHYELLLNFGLKYTSDEEFVKDCIQDVFVKLCTSKRLSSTEYVRSYLLTSLKNVISDKLSSLRLTEDLNEHFFELKIEDAALESLFNGNDEELQLSKKLINAYKSLPENQRVAIYLRYVKGLSYKEMAAVLNINPQSSMNLVSRALTSLRSKMTLDEYLLFIILFFS
ncbi:RNA polymerase sigma factor [Bacteroides acidifaciens]|uniref:RNA polymerase sigma factor n=1 Tax=Bacteroides acidifaciens TaxID=85831 RepID=UPI002604DB59|nr:sigma-70 family RNA polymerase sigma factor [Bacteroides acidifaciens]